MEISKLVRDAKRVHANLREMPDESLVVLKPCKVYIPTRFQTTGLAEIGAETQIVGLAAIVFEDAYYAVLSVNAMVKITPSRIEKVKINNTEYYEFHFTAGSTLTPNLNLFVNTGVLYDVYNEILASAKVPWYLSYNDLGSIFDTSGKHAGGDIAKRPEVIEIIVAKIARQPQDKNLPYALLAKTPEVMAKTRASYVPVKSVIFSATNTLTKLAGSYMQHGVISAIVRPTERTEKLEAILRR